MKNVIDQYQGRNFAFYNGDSCEILPMIPSDSIHFSLQCNRHTASGLAETN